MKRIIAAVAAGASLMSMECTASDYTMQDANGDAAHIWSSGCSDFKNGMNEGDYIKWLRLEGKVKELPQIKRTAVVRLYMDGWDTARVMKGVIRCDDFAKGRSDEYVSGIDIRQL